METYRQGVGGTFLRFIEDGRNESDVRGRFIGISLAAEMAKGGCI